MARTPRALPPEAHDLIAEACRLHESQTGLAGERESLIDQRDELWAQLRGLGVTDQAIAEACGVSRQLVTLALAKARGASWA